MPTFTRTRRMTGAAGVQTFTHGPDKAVTALTVNGTAATFTDAGNVVTISSPTLAGGEALVATESQTPPSIPAAVPFILPQSASVTLTRKQNGTSTAQTLTGVSDVTGNDPELSVANTRSNH